MLYFKLGPWRRVEGFRYKQRLERARSSNFAGGYDASLTAGVILASPGPPWTAPVPQIAPDSQIILVLPGLFFT